jgi:hypothetical protein
LFLVDWMKGAIPVEKETCVLGTKEEAITAAKTRAPDVIKRHSGREPDSFRLTDANGKIVAMFPFVTGSDNKSRPAIMRPRLAPRSRSSPAGTAQP